MRMRDGEVELCGGDGGRGGVLGDQLVSRRDYVARNGLCRLGDTNVGCSRSMVY